MLNNCSEILSIVNKSNPSTMDYYRFIQLVHQDDLLYIANKYKLFLNKMFLKQDSKNELFEKLLNNFEYFYRNKIELSLLKDKLDFFKDLYFTWKVCN